MTKQRLALAGGLLALLPACGHRGDPLPPLRKTPPAPGAFRMAQRGDTIELAATAPAASIDGQAFDAVTLEFLHVTGENDLERVGTRLTVRVTPGQRHVERLLLPAPGTLIRAAVSAIADGDKGTRTLPRTLVVQKPLEAPRELVATLAEGGVALTWRGPLPEPATPPPRPMQLPDSRASEALRRQASAGEGGQAEAAIAPPKSGFFVYRRMDGHTDEALLGKVPIVLRDYEDTKAPLGVTACYVVRAVGSVDPLIESAPSNEVCLARRDITPPESPVGLAVVPRPDALELLWSPSRAEDIAGYRIHRSADGAAPEELAELPPEVTSYVDEAVQRGSRYSYAITAFDTAGNESTRSEPVQASLP